MFSLYVMVRFNQPTQKSNNTAVNYEGQRSFKGDPYLELYLMTATNLMGEPKFYGNTDDQYKEWLTAVRNMISKDPMFVLQLAAYTRNELKLRTAPIVMLTECIISGNPIAMANAEYFAPKIIQRADEPAEIIAYYISQKGKIGTDTPKSNGLPNKLKKIINKELLSDKFNEYQLIKNDKNNASVKLRDVLRITHPPVRDNQTREFFRRVVKQEAFPEIEEDTWEGYISKHGSNVETWTHILPSMPIFALIRNLRNILDAGVDRHEIEDRIIKKLRSNDIITKSRILPFRFYQANKEVERRNYNLSAALEEACLTATLHNTPKLEGTTAIFIDTSGSMGATISEKSKMSRCEIASLLGGILYKKNPFGTHLYQFDNDCRPVNNVTPQDSIFHIVKQILSTSGGATYAYKCMNELMNNRIFADRIIFLSDMQSYNERVGGGYINYSSYGRYSNPGPSQKSVAQLLKDYRGAVNPNVMLYDIDLAGYNRLQFDPNNLRNVFMGGWSERVFDLMTLTESLGKTDIRKLVSELYTK